jgi:tetratricopeptide (TPR) repeat protein
MEKKKLFNAVLAALVVAVSFGVHINVLFNGLVYDEVGLVLKNPLIRDLSNIPEVFSGDIWKFTGYVGGSYYRPVVHLIYMADYHIFGLNPWGYHLSKLLLHAGSTLLVFLIASTIIKRHMNGGSDTEAPQFYIPFAAALLFAIHPVHTECVTIATAEVSFALFFLLSFYLYLSSDGVWGVGLIASTLFFFLAMLCKETALTLPALIFAYDYTFKKAPTLNEDLSPGTIYTLVRRYFPYLVAAGLYFALRTYALWGIPTVKTHPELGAWGYLINVFPLFAQHLGKLIVPVNLNAAYVLHPVTTVLEWKTLLSTAVVLGFIAAVYVARNMNRVVFFGLLWIAVPLLPALYIPALGEHVFAERYLYLPSVGFVIIAATALCAVASFARPGGRAVSFMLSAVFIIGALYSAGTIIRIPVWKDNLTLWLDTVKKSPDSHIVHLNLGLAYKEAGKLDEAALEYKKALEIKPDYGAAHNNLGIIHDLQGRLDEAAGEYRKALELNPSLVIAHNNLGVIYFKQGRLD